MPKKSTDTLENLTVEMDERLDQELFEAIYKGAELPEGMTPREAIGKAMAAAVPIEDLEDLIEQPSRETFEEWIRKGEELRESRVLDELIERAENRIYGFTLEEWNSMSEEEQIRIQDNHEYDLQHEDQAEWFID